MKKTFAVLTLAGLAFGAACSDMTTLPTPLAAPDGGPSLGLISGNATCSQLLNKSTAYEIKIDPPKSGSYGPITATFTDGGKLLSYTSTVPVVAVFVKGGPTGGYLYHTAEGYPKTSDSGMSVNGYVPPATAQHGISHVSFCWNDKSEVENPPTALVVSKTANGSYNRRIDWDLTKSVDPASHSGTAGASAGTSTWTVVATKKVSESGFSVSGTITISNPNTSAVNFSVDDVLSDGTVAIVTCPSGGATGTVPAKSGSTNGSITCSYTASPADASATSNNALVTSLTSGVPGGTALQTITWTPTLDGSESAQLSDPRLSINQTVTGNTTLTPTETFPCSSDEADYQNDGQYTRTETNTATLTGQYVTGSPASASVEITCTLPPLTAEKTAAGSYDRTITWTLAKSVAPSSHSGIAGQNAGNSTWSVAATRSAVENNYRVTGQIVITNPAAAAVSFTVTDELNNGAAASVSCPSYSVPAGGSVTCSYEALNAQGATLNTATIISQGRTTTATAPVTFTANVIGHESGTLADPRFIYSELISGTTTPTFPETFPCPADASLYTNGTYTRTEVNTATLNGNLNLSATAQVTITCTMPPPPSQWAGETATGRGTQWPGTSNWFMYTGYTTSKVDLVAGRTFLDAGDIFMSRSGSTTTIRIVLHDGWRWADVKDNLKIVPLDAAPKSYMEPGSFPHKFRVSGQEVTVTIPNSGKAKFFGIHGDVERRLP
ncbi:hypothetical protein BH24GEM3_BH24GEM3_22120 [soil metagenome]